MLNLTFMENLTRYTIRASFSQERMQYLAEPSKVVYRAKDGTEEKVFDAPVSSTGQALEWLTAMCSHIPDRGNPADGGSTVLWLLQYRLPGKAKRNRRRRSPLHPGSGSKFKEIPKELGSVDSEDLRS